MKKVVATSLALLFAFSAAQRGLAQTARHGAQQQPARAEQSAADYTCPMHPRVKSRLPGKCPHCGMNLARSGAKAAPSDPTKDAAAERVALQAMKIPDVSVVDQDGRRLKFYSDLVRGKTVAVNFIFTTCTTICPPLAATFRRVQQTLGARAADVQLISISVDPVTDTPERMKAFLGKFKAAPGWSFVSGEKHDIDALLKALGGFSANKNDHTPVLLVGNDAANRWTRTYGLASASSIIKVLDEAAAHAPAAQPQSQSQARPQTQRPASFVPAAFVRAGEGRSEATGEWMKMRLLTSKASEIADAAVRLADQLKAAKAPKAL